MLPGQIGQSQSASKENIDPKIAAESKPLPAKENTHPQKPAGSFQDQIEDLDEQIVVNEIDFNDLEFSKEISEQLLEPDISKHQYSLIDVDFFFSEHPDIYSELGDITIEYLSLGVKLEHDIAKLEKQLRPDLNKQLLTECKTASKNELNFLQAGLKAIAESVSTRELAKLKQTHEHTKRSFYNSLGSNASLMDNLSIFIDNLTAAIQDIDENVKSLESEMETLETVVCSP